MGTISRKSGRCCPSSVLRRDRRHNNDTQGGNHACPPDHNFLCGPGCSGDLSHCRPRARRGHRLHVDAAPAPRGGAETSRRHPQEFSGEGHLRARGAGTAGDAHEGRSRGGQAHGELDCRRSWRAAAAPGHRRARSHRRRRGEARRSRHSREPHAARQARHRQAALYPLDAGDLHHGRQQEGAALSAGRGRRQHAQLRSADGLGEGNPGEDGTAPARVSRGAQGPDAPVLRRLSLSGLYRRRRDPVPLRRSGDDVGSLQGAVANGQSEFRQLRFHAGAAAGRRGLARLRPRGAAQGGTARQARRLRHVPGAGRTQRARLHGGRGGALDRQGGAQPRRRRRRHRVSDQARGAGNDRVRGRVLPGGQGGLAREPGRRHQARGSGGRQDADRARRARELPAGGPRRQGRRVQQGLHGYVPTHRTARRADPSRARQPSGGAESDHDGDERALLGAGSRRRWRLPRQVSAAAEPATVPRAERASTPRVQLLPYLLVAPSLIFLAVLFALPFAQTVLLSVTDGDQLSLANYAKMAGDLNFAPALRNTFALVLMVIPVQLVLALAMAMMLQKVRVARDIVLWIWTIPLAVSDLAAGLAWFAILQDSGYLNSFLYAVGAIPDQQAWLSYETPSTLFLGIAAAEVWRATAIVLVILVAGVQLIPREYGEAAEVFGATAWQRFSRITLPLLKPSLQTALILRTVLAFEVFAVVYALGGRNFPVLVGEAFVWQHENQNYGVAAAYAVLVMAVSLAATVVYLRALRVPREQQS